MQGLNQLQPMLQPQHFSEPAMYNIYLAHLAGFVDSDHHLNFGTEYNENGQIQNANHHPIEDMLTVNNFQNEELYFVYYNEMMNIIPKLVHVGPHGYQIQPPQGCYENIDVAVQLTPQQWLDKGNKEMQVQNLTQTPQQSVMNIQNLNIQQQNLFTKLPRIRDIPELSKHTK